MGIVALVVGLHGVVQLSARGAWLFRRKNRPHHSALAHLEARSFVPPSRPASRVILHLRRGQASRVLLVNMRETVIYLSREAGGPRDRGGNSIENVNNSLISGVLGFFLFFSFHF